VTAASGIRTLDEVDRPGVRVVGIANTTTIRAVEGVRKACEQLKAGAIASGRCTAGALAIVPPRSTGRPVRADVP
jgi:hypothetical protein